MAIQYKSIYDMPQATQLGAQDRFMVAKGTADNFTTEAVLYNKLSSDTYKILETAKFDVDIIRDRNALNQSGANKVAHAQVINAINNDLNGVMNNYIPKNSDYTCTTQWNFTQIPKYQNNELATMNNVQRMLDNFAKTHPIYTNSWTNQDTANRRLILSDLIPTSQCPEQLTIYVLFQTKTTTAYTPKFACTVNGSAMTIERFSGTEKIDYNHKNLNSWAHYRVKLSGIGTINPVSMVYLDIDTVNSNIMCSLVIYGIHTY